jgi:hypothetical protein
VDDVDYRSMFEAGLTALGVTVAVGWFFWQRFLALEKRFGHIESELMMQKHRQDLSSQLTESNQLNIQQLVESNKALIEHRTQRFTEQINSVEGRLGGDIKEIKNWLDAHTEFKLRDR